MAEVIETELAIIHELEKTIARIIPQFDSRNLGAYGDVGYKVDDNGEIIGLSLVSCNLTDISILSQLKKLTKLFLYKNRIVDISPIMGLTALTKLNLGRNKIADIKPLSELKNLINISLRRNQINDLSPISELKELTHLNLSNNKISDVGPLIGLQNLNGLNLRRNEIVDIAPISKLKKLANLNVSKNAIEDLKPISELDNLISLLASGNRIADIEPLSLLKKLMILNLGHNRVVDVSPIGKVTTLTKIDLRDNPIREIPRTLLDLNLTIHYERVAPSNEKQLVFWNNPLEIPPIEVVKQGKAAIQNYFQAINLEAVEGKEAFCLYEAKLLVVGRGDVGKTWLTHRLVSGKLPVKAGTTRGIDIHVWRFATGDVKEFRANLWDFGGQQILHSTHQFFLTKRSLYLFVWEARTDDDIVSFDYWLNIIKLLSDSSPVLVVMNKCDERIKNIDERTYIQNFNVIGFYKVSAKDDIGIKELRNLIQEEMVKLPHIGTPLPRMWMKIREKLENLNKPYILYREYLDICLGFGLDRTQADHLSGYYHNVGVILHFKDNPVLQDMLFLQPEWVTEAVYQVVENLEVVKKNGRFRYGQLAEILDTQRYPVEIHHKLLELMIKFELCFELEGKNEYIVPELLKGDRPNIEWDYQNNLRFEYDYKFMPTGIITRFIARIHELHKNELYWKNGVVLDRESNTQALVICETMNRKIRVWIRGQDPRGLLAIIRHHIDHIHETLNNPEVEQMLSCNCKQCQQGKDPYLHKYQELLVVQEKGKDARCNKSAEDVSIEELFGEYGLEEESNAGEEDDDDIKQEPLHIEVSPVINVAPVFYSPQSQGGSTKQSKNVLKMIGKIVSALIIFAGLVWTCVQIWESNTCQNWIYGDQIQKQNKKENPTKGKVKTGREQKLKLVENVAKNRK